MVAFVGNRRALLRPGTPAWVTALYGAATPHITGAVNLATGQAWVRGAGQLGETAWQDTSCASSLLVPDSSGVYQTIPVNALPRANGTGAQWFGSRTNYALHSQDFTNATAWVPATVTITSGAIIGPDGTLSGTKLQSNASGGRVNQYLTATSTTYTYYVIAKYGNTNQFTTLLRNNTTSTTLGSATFNLQAGTGTGIIRIGTSDWYICPLTVTTGITVGDTLALYIYAGGSGSAPGDYVYIWEADLQNVLFVTPPIITSGSAVTVATPITTLKGAMLAAALAAKGAALVTNGVAGGTGQRIIDNSSRIIALNSLSQSTIIDGANNAVATLGSGTFANMVNSAYGFSSSGMSARANGGALGSSAPAFSGFSGPIYLGNNPTGSLPLNGSMQSFAFLDTDATAFPSLYAAP